MKYFSVVCALCVLVALTNGAPMPQNDQVIDNVIQNVTSTAFRVIGRVVLQSGALGIGGGGGGGSASGGSRVSVVLPTFGPDDDDYDDDEEESNNIVASSSTSTTEASSSSTTTTTTTSSASEKADKDLDIRIGDKRDLGAANANHISDIAPYTSPASETRSKRETHQRTIRAAEDAEVNDQESAASGGNGLNPSDDLSNVEADDADRDKRFLPFGGSFGASASAGGSAGGSGNFLFDIIRSTADGAARAAGTVYRMIAGTENVGLGFTATASSARTFLPQLVAGSGATEESDEKDNAPAGPGGVVEIDVAKGASSEGIPGPITRLFVLANRGLANLIQDLILRIASTSERIVNFKARLITALI